MEKYLLDKLSQTTDEERRILAGEPFEPKLYFEDRALIKSEKMLGTVRAEIGIKFHPRYAEFPEHGHDFVEMMIALSGNITHRIAGRRITLGRGDILLMNKHIRHSIDRADQGDLGVNIIMTDSFVNSLSPELGNTVFEDFLKENARPLGAGMLLHFSAHGRPQAENLIENIILELSEPTPSNAILSRTLALLFSYLAVKKEMLTEASVPETAESRRRSEITSYIKSNYRSARLDELGARLFLSVPYLSSLISDYFGKSFKELLLEERLRRADELITRTDIPVCEVISNVGYENYSYFHREYKARFGQTPLERRKKARASV